MAVWWTGFLVLGPVGFGVGCYSGCDSGSGGGAVDGDADAVYIWGDASVELP